MVVVGTRKAGARSSRGSVRVSPRQEMEQIFERHLERNKAGVVVDAIQDLVKWRDGERRSNLKRNRSARAAGRPGSSGIEDLQLLAAMAFIYEYATRDPVKSYRRRFVDRPRSRTHPFFRLAQICLKIEDPTALIAQTRSTYWGKQTQFDLIRFWRGPAEVVDLITPSGFDSSRISG